MKVSTFYLPYINRGPIKNSDGFSAKSQQFGYQIIDYKLPEIWSKTQGEGIKIAVLDTGCQVSHPDLAGSFVSGSTHNRDEDRHGHGSHCCGIISGNNNDLGIVGVAPKVVLEPIKVLGDDGSGSFSGVTNGVLEAIDLGADIISMSLGAAYNYRPLRDAIRKAYDLGIPTIAAAGNSGNTGKLDYPGNYAETISVGALDNKKLRAGFSQTGANLDFMAPGVSILSCIPGGEYQYMSGTSMATPWLAGVLALIISKHRMHGGGTPVDTVEQMREHLKRVAVDLEDVGRDRNTGWGLIDVGRAIDEIRGTMKIIVSQTQFDAPGKERDNLNEEWVEFKNIGTADADMVGWNLTDDNGRWHYVFPDRFKLGAGKAVKVRTGIGDDTDTDLYWGFKRAIWNNEGDVVKLSDVAGNLYLKFEPEK